MSKQAMNYLLGHLEEYRYLVRREDADDPDPSVSRSPNEGSRSGK